MVWTLDLHDKRNAYLFVAIFFAASLVLGDYGIRFYVYILQVELPHEIIAGLTEPITTKFVPAFVVVWMHQYKEVPSTNLQSQPFKYAFVGGVTLGLFERLLYVIVKDVSVSPVFLAAIFIHIVNAMLISGLIFSNADQQGSLRFYGKLIVVTLLGIAIHVYWNRWGVVRVAAALA